MADLRSVNVGAAATARGSLAWHPSSPVPGARTASEAALHGSRPRVLGARRIRVGKTALRSPATAGVSLADRNERTLPPMPHEVLRQSARLR